MDKVPVLAPKIEVFTFICDSVQGQGHIFIVQCEDIATKVIFVQVLTKSIKENRSYDQH